MFLLGDTAGIVPIRKEDLQCAEKDEEGNVTNEGSSSSDATGGEYGTTTEVTVETQQTVFRIKVDISEADKIIEFLNINGFSKVYLYASL